MRFAFALLLLVIALIAGACASGGGLFGPRSAGGTIEGNTQPGVLVIIENRSTGLRQEIAANSKGAYRSKWLPVGTYTVTANGMTREVVITGAPTPKLSEIID